MISFRKGFAGADGPLRVLLYVEREMYKLLHGGTSLGVNMAEMAGIAGIAEKSGKSGLIFFLLLSLLRCCISFFVHRVDSRYWQPLRDSRTRQTRAGQPATGRAGRRVRTLQIGSVASVRASLVFSRASALGYERLSSLSLSCAGPTGYGQPTVLPGPSFEVRFPAEGVMA